MNYHPQDYIALSNAVEEEGGSLLLPVCKGTSVRYKLPSPGGGRIWKRYQTTHCDQSALMEIPYDPTVPVRIFDDEESDVVIVNHSGEPRQKDGSAVVVCAVDDCVGLWPRFKNTITERSYQRL